MPTLSVERLKPFHLFGGRSICRSSKSSFFVETLSYCSAGS
jgi:hypothetical protein